MTNVNYELTQLDTVEDYFFTAVEMVRLVAYQKLTESEQARVKVNFFELLKQNNVILTKETVDQAEQQYQDSVLPSLLRQYGYYVPAPASKFDPAVEQLTNGLKVTLIKLSEFGFPVLINTVIESAEIKPYAQHKDTLYIVHKPKRKKSLYSNRIMPYAEILVYDGWLVIDLDNITKTTLKENEHMKVTQGKYCSFDKNYMIDIKNAIQQQPLVYIQ